MKSLAIIPARIGSKGVPLKNIRKVKDKPLIEYTIDTAKKFKKFDKIIVSTDSKKIAKISEANGIEVPFLRPKKISSNKSKSIDYVKFVLKKLKKNEDFVPEIITILQPTSPVRQIKTITKCIQILKKTDASSVITVTKSKHHPYLSFWLNNKNYLKPFKSDFSRYYQRQKFPEVYYPTGSVYTFNTENLKKYNNIYGPKIKPVILHQDESIDIDSVFDLFIAEMRISYWEEFKKNLKI